MDHTQKLKMIYKHHLLDYQHIKMNPTGEIISSLIDPKEYSKSFVQQKKRRKNLKRNIATLDENDINPSDDQDNQVNFTVNSSRDSKKKYQTKIINDSTGFRFECNCGDQYGVPTRDHCRHIGTVITSMLKRYVDLSLKKPEAKIPSTVNETNMSELESMFSNFMQISGN